MVAINILGMLSIGSIVRYLGPISVFLLPGVTILSMILTIHVLRLGNSTSAGLVAIAVCPLPFLVGLFAGMKGLLASLSIISISGDIRPEELVDMLSVIAVIPLTGGSLSLVVYLTTVVVMSWKALGRSATS